MQYRSVTSKRQMYIDIYIYIYICAHALLFKLSVFADCTSEKVGFLGGGGVSIYIYI